MGMHRNQVPRRDPRFENPYVVVLEEEGVMPGRGAQRVQRVGPGPPGGVSLPEVSSHDVLACQRHGAQLAPQPSIALAAERLADQRPGPQ